MQDLRSLIISGLEMRIGLSSAQSWFGRADFLLEGSQGYDLAVQSDGSGRAICKTANKRLKVICPSSFIKSWIQSNYANALSEVVLSLGLNQVEIEFGINPKKGETCSKLIQKTASLSKISTPLNPKLTFDNFIVDSSNKFAFETIRKNEGHVFLSGDSGNGKTHLVQAMTNEALLKGWETCYIHSQEYVSKFISTIQNNNLIQFKQNFFNLDLLIVDDIQFLKGKRASQELFLEILMYFLTYSKKIIMVGDSVLGLSDRIISYINSGLCVEIKEPSYELKLNILKKKTRNNIDDNILEYIASSLQGSIREIEGAILRIQSHLDFFGGVITLKNIDQILTELHIQQKREPSVEALLKVVSSFYDISKEQLVSKSRVSILTHARSISMFILRNMLKKSLIDIGKIFGNSSHTNALQNIRKVEHAINNNQHLRNELKEIEMKLYGS